jgi:hypothetical protein
MNISIQSEWHAGGTDVPGRPERNCLQADKSVRRAAEVVPFRAVGEGVNRPGSVELCGSGVSEVPSGTTVRNSLFASSEN